MSTVEQQYIDKYGRLIDEFDVLKMFHFTGHRRKKYFMYKQVLLQESRNIKYWVVNHLDGNPKNTFWLKSLANGERIIKSVEVIQSRDFEKLEYKKLK